jgi:hypothetical protein
MSWPITGADVWEALQYQGNPDDDAELYARAATERIEEEVGPVSGATSSSTLRGPIATITLDRVYGSVTVTVDGAAFTGYTPDLAAGFLRGPFPAGTIQIEAADPTSKSALLEIATRELAAIWYRQAKGPRGPQSRNATSTFTPLGFAIPREISEKIEKLVAAKLPGIA